MADMMTTNKFPMAVVSRLIAITNDFILIGAYAKNRVIMTEARLPVDSQTFARPPWPGYVKEAENILSLSKSKLTGRFGGLS